MAPGLWLSAHCTKGKLRPGGLGDAQGCTASLGPLALSPSSFCTRDPPSLGASEWASMAPETPSPPGRPGVGSAPAGTSGVRGPGQGELSLVSPQESDEDKSDYNLVVDEVSRTPACAL